MKLCVLSEYFYPDNMGGTGTVISALVRQLKDEYDDLEIDVITSRNLFRGDVGPLPVSEEWDGVQIRRLKTPQPRKRSMRRRLAANLLFTGAALKTLLARRKKYDVVLVVTAPPTLPLAARLFSKLTGTPYIYLVYDLYLDMALSMNMVRSDSRTARAMHATQRDWLQKSSKVVVLGRCMRDRVLMHYNLAPEQVEVVPIPANLNLVQTSERSTQGATRFRTQANLDGFVVLYAGNFAQYQDFETLLDAAALLHERTDITFAFVGDGAKRAYLEERVAKDQLSNVRLFPFVPEEELSDLLASADVSLVTLEKQAVGLAVPSKFYNILASGRATVAVVDPLSEVGRVVQEADCGVQVTPEDPQHLAAVLAELADAPERVADMGRNARQHCEDSYSLSHVGHRFHSLFQSVVNPLEESETGIATEAVLAPVTPVTPTPLLERSETTLQTVCVAEQRQRQTRAS